MFNQSINQSINQSKEAFGEIFACPCQNSGNKIVLKKKITWNFWIREAGMKKLIFWVLIMMFSIVYFSQTPTELIINGGFEQSKSLYPWVVETTKGGVLVSGPNENGNPHGGNRYVTLGGTNKETDAIEQTIIIPQNLQSLTLSFAMRIKATGNDKTPHDFFTVIVKGELINDTLVQYSNVNSCEWQTISIPNLISYAGRLITVRFEATTDGTKPTKFMIDDVSLVYTAGQGTPTPNLEFISPYFGCVYPISTITGATPLTVIADAPNGVESLAVSIDDEVIATTTEKRLDIPINWSNLTPGPHTLEAELIDPIGGRKLKRCTITSSNLLEGGDFKGYYPGWVGASVDGELPLVRQFDEDFTYDGDSSMQLGSLSGSSEFAEHFLAIPDDSEDVLTLAFFYKTSSASALIKDNSLSVYLVDAETYQSYLLGTITQASSDWLLVRIPVSMNELGIQKGRDYLLKFQADTAQGSKFTSFYVDDVALYVYSETLASGASLADDDGDIPGNNTPGCSIVDITPHKDPPNTCSCGHTQHATVTITTSGFNLPQGTNISSSVLKVKFKIPNSTTGKQAENVCVNGNIITCRVPDCSDKNYFGPSDVKVKVVSSGQKAWSRGYSAPSSTGTGEKGFFYGFPEKIQNIQVSPTIFSVLGNESVTITASGLVTFYQKVNGICQTSAGYSKPPVIFAADGQEGRVKVKSLSNTCGSNVWSALWTRDGAPVVCKPPNRCINCGNPVSIRMWNADATDPNSDSNWPAPRLYWDWFKGEKENALTFTRPPYPPSLVTGTGYGPANSVGYYKDARGNCQDSAIRPLNGATNYVTFSGSNIFRITDIYNDDDNTCNFCCLGGTAAGSSDYGKKLFGWAPAHPVGASSPKVVTKDWGTISALPLNYVASFADNGSSDCLKSGQYCQKYINNMVTPGNLFADKFYIGPGESDITCQVSCIGGQCSKVSITPITVTIDNGGVCNNKLRNASVNLYVNREASTTDFDATFAVTPKSSYGNIETLYYTFFFPASGSGDLIVSIFPDKTTGSAPLTVHFTTAVSGGCGSYQYNWNFGDGQQGTGSEVYHQFSSDGTYNVVLTVSEIGSGNCTGRTGSSSTTITVGAGNLTATIVANPSSGPPPLSVNFTCNASGGSGCYTNYAWNFGNGQTYSGSNNSASTTYSNVGTYTVSCSVTDSNYNSVQATTTVTVTSGLTLSASASPTSAASAPVTVTFTCAVSGGQTPYSYLWEFGDGGTSIEQNTTHTYTANGTYFARITVADGNGLSASKTITIKVGNVQKPPNGEF
ncbi:MAG: PKD domain-containing protein [candidate division WOR-3 bacterium]